VVYLIFNEGYVATGGDDLGRTDLAGDAIRLGRLLTDLMPDESEVIGLLALMLLTEARRGGRTGRRGELIRLSEQDRALWDRDMIDEGHELVRACLRRNTPGPYQIQAAIAAVHADAGESAGTDWNQIVSLYDPLVMIAPTPVVVLNRAIAVAEAGQPATALQIVDGLELDSYHLFHATRGDLLERLDRRDEAADAFTRAASLTSNRAERSLLTRRATSLRPDET
jgi:RNA polymerase sigma-70 factor (ECF subfamily)